MLANNYQKYQQNAVMTASKGDLTLMLYNGAIKFCNLGLEGIESKDIQKANDNILKAQNIISELQITLDSKYEFSKDINALYDYIMRLLVEANIHKDREKLLEAKGFIVQFRDMWKEVMKKAH